MLEVSSVERHTCNPSTQEAELGVKVGDHQGQHSKTLSQINDNNITMLEWS
jgi:hypothetical protein